MVGDMVNLRILAHRRARGGHLRRAACSASRATISRALAAVMEVLASASGGSSLSPSSSRTHPDPGNREERIKAENRAPLPQTACRRTSERVKRPRSWRHGIASRRVCRPGPRRRKADATGPNLKKTERRPPRPPLPR
jgi:hypothetical protein